jgi:iron complex outermembrane receptor protein
MPKFDDVNPIVTLATGAGAGSITNPDKGGNAELKAEEARGIELGVEHYFWGNRGVAGINFYNRDVKDFIQKMSSLEGARYVERPYNAGDARFWGVELDWRLPVLRKGPHQITLTGNHSELRGQVKNSSGSGESDVKDMPPRITTLGLDWLHTPSRWSAGFVVNHTPDYQTDSVDGDGKREIKKRNKADLLDLYIQKSFSAAAEIRLIAKNVLAIDKDEATRKYNANGSFSSAEAKVESSKPTIFLTFESRF